MLDTSTWTNQNPSGTIAVIDPLGVWENKSALNNKLVGGTASYLSRNSLANISGSASAEAAFLWQDDLNFVSAKESTSSNPANGDRPILVVDGNGYGYIGNFSWFLTVAASPSEVQAGIPWYQAAPLLQRRQFSISVVVCWKRDFTVDTTGQPQGEQTCDLGGPLPSSIGGATITLPATDANMEHPINKVKEDQWVMLVAFDSSTPPVPIMANWYRIVGVGRDLSQTSPPVNMLSLVGPDWNTTNLNVTSVKLIVVNGVTGVYTRTVELDYDATWSR